jgi:AsmA protein
VKTPQLKQPVNVRNANLQFTQNSVVLQNLAASVGQTNATGGLTMRNFSAPQVQFTLNADKVNVAELEQLFSSGVPQQQQKRAAASIVPQAEAAATSSPSLLTKMTGGGNLSIGNVIDDQLQLANVHSDVTLDHGVIRMQPLTAQLYNGQENGSVVVDMRPTPITYAISSKVSNVDANKLVSSMSSLKQTIYGLLASAANVSFSGTSTDQMTRTLNGKLSIDLRNGKIVGMDILNELSQVGKFVGFNHAATNFTNIVQLTGDFNVRNGVAQTNNLKAVIDGGTLAAAGSVGLADQSLNMNLTAVLSKGMSDAVGGTGIGGLMNTALANNRGELVIPVIVTGTFSHPQFAPDMQKIAQMKVQNLLPTSGNPGQLTNGLLGALMGGQRGGAGQNQQQGGLGGILGALQGNQRQQQQPAQNQQNRAAQPQQRQKSNNPIGDTLNSIFGGQQQQQDQQQNQQNQQRR